MSTEDLVGRSYPPVGPFRVGRELIRGFATATKNTNPVHHDLAAARAAGHQDLVAPPTYLVTLAQRAEAHVVADPNVDIDFARTVHADERFTHHKPVVAGDDLEAVATIASIKTLGAHRMVTTRTEITSVSRGPVATVTSTLLVRGDTEEN